MYQAVTTRNAHKKPLSAGRARYLVRLTRRDLGLGDAGLAVVRALVVGGGEAARAARKGEGGGSRFIRGGDAAMGLGRRNLV